MKCKNCGCEFDEGNYCPKCGIKYDEKSNTDYISNNFSGGSSFPKNKETKNVFLKKSIGFVVLVISIFIIWGLTVHEHWLVSNVDYSENDIVREKHTYVYHGDDYIMYANIIKSTTKYIIVQYDTFLLDGYTFNEYEGEFSKHHTYSDVYKTVKFYKLKNEYDVYVTATISHKLKLSNSEDKRIFERATAEDVEEFKKLIKSGEYGEIYLDNEGVSDGDETEDRVDDYVEVQMDNNTIESVKKVTTEITTKATTEATTKATTEATTRVTTESKTKVTTELKEIAYEVLKEGLYQSANNMNGINVTREASVEEKDSMIFIDIKVYDLSESYEYNSMLLRQSDGTYISQESDEIKSGITIYSYNDYIVIKSQNINDGDYIQGEYHYIGQKEVAEKNDDYIFPDSDTRFLTEDDITRLSMDELAFARNEIYARRGYIFKDQLFVDYFMAKEWYVPQYTGDEFDDSVFNQYEKKNIEFIKNHE